MLDYDIFLMHGAVIGYKNAAYLFTAVSVQMSSKILHGVQTAVSDGCLQIFELKTYRNEIEVKLK